jgi:hypothetical protein
MKYIQAYLHYNCKKYDLLLQPRHGDIYNRKWRRSEIVMAESSEEGAGVGQL